MAFSPETQQSLYQPLNSKDHAHDHDQKVVVGSPAATTITTTTSTTAGTRVAGGAGATPGAAAAAAGPAAGAAGAAAVGPAGAVGAAGNGAVLPISTRSAPSRLDHDNEVSSSSEDDDDDDDESSSLEGQEVPFNIPTSEVVSSSKWRSAATLLLVAACIFCIHKLDGVYDPVSFIASGYIVTVSLMQNTFLEWPRVTLPLAVLLVLSLVTLLAPTFLQLHELWTLPIKVTFWVGNVLLVVSGYWYMVRGPSYVALDKRKKRDSVAKRVFLITGCNTGIGFETAQVLACGGATVIFACRSEDKARAAMRRIVENPKNKVSPEQLIFLQLDTSSFASVRRSVAAFEAMALPLHTLILNAGVMLSSRSYSEDGLEKTLATNHFGHFLLVQLLLPSLLAAEARGERPRIVVVGSNMCYRDCEFDFSECEVVSPQQMGRAMKKRYDIMRAYGQSKLANLYFTTELARRLRAKGSLIPVNEIHPGEVLTEVMRDMHVVILRLRDFFRPVAYAFMKTPLQGAFCTLHVATDPELGSADECSGAHFVRNEPMPLSMAGANKEAAGRLWQISEQVTSQQWVV